MEGGKRARSEKKRSIHAMKSTSRHLDVRGEAKAGKTEQKGIIKERREG